MQFIPYNAKYADKVLKMMRRHFDYTPELASADNNSENINYFEDVYCKERCSEISYVLNAEDETIIGFLEATERKCEKGQLCWYITALFALDCEEADSNARVMVELFCRNLRDADEVCANVHPAVDKAVRFWMNIGFVPNPERSIFTNSEDQRLIAYWKKL